MKAPVLAIAIPHHSDDGGGSDESDHGDHGGDAEEIAGELADLLGVPDDKHSKFAELLHAYMDACEAEEGDSGDEGESEHAY